MNVVPIWAWIATPAVIGALLAVDMLVGRAANGRGLPGALVASSLWVAVSVAFGLVLALGLGPSASRMSRLPWNFGDGPRGFQATS